MKEYVYVVTAQNVALGVYPRYADATESIIASDPKAWEETSGPCFSRFVGEHTYTVVAVRPSPGPSPLFQS